jgi:hypothetical protein
MTSPMIPVSLFRSIYDTGYNKRKKAAAFFLGLNQMVPWKGFCRLLTEYSRFPFPDKASAPLFSPTVYLCRLQPHTKGYWCKDNCTTSGMAVIDADAGLTYDYVVNMLATCRLEAICYTSASNRDGDRFRTVVPLSETVEPAVHTAVVVAICRFLSEAWKSDASKNYSYMKFYVPGQYAGADNHFVHLRGDILPPEAWLELGGRPETKKEKKEARQLIVPPNGLHTLHSPDSNGDWSIETHCEDFISAYVSSASNRHQEHFRTMVRVAMRAIKNGYYIDTSDLAAFGDGLYFRNPGKSKHNNMVQEAANAIAFAECAVSPPSPTKSRWPEGLGPQSLEELLASIDEAHALPPPPARKGPKTLAEYITSLE